MNRLQIPDAVVPAFDKKEGQQAIFYAEQGNCKIPLKGAIIPGEAIDESLAVWIKNYLSQ